MKKMTVSGLSRCCYLNGMKKMIVSGFSRCYLNGSLYIYICRGAGWGVREAGWKHE